MKTIHLNLGVSVSDFDLEKAVCNHGQFMMPPNQWIPSSKTLQRPLRLSDSHSSVFVSINQPSSSLLTIQIHSSSTPLSPQDQQAILDQVVRMLRLTEKDEDELRKFQSLHPRAKQMGFGRLFRSPTLFEDALKSILLCNTTWKRTLAMAGQLCELQAKMRRQITRKRKRKLGEKEGEIGNFPNAEEVCRMGVELLKKHCLGYRAAYIINFAKCVQSGKIDLQNPNYFPKIKGFGPFATANVLMCLGLYRQLPIDTETIRHLKQVHGRQFCNNKTVREDVKQIYDKYAPFQCLAYWLEALWSIMRANSGS
ncbi:uncharacterized protein LOC120069874 [Benincasa hispida]|uniref:uncharacterized protein LOC120069874 n=1 Tax=Benincasa hispida TaxID=102211 RepID=UPI0018FF3027|nr:uncharacterized protein LOC120069874 [Benincasa hispida]